MRPPRIQKIQFKFNDADGTIDINGFVHYAGMSFQYDAAIGELRVELEKLREIYWPRDK